MEHLSENPSIAESPAENKKGRLCVCGESKYSGTPYCPSCWSRVPKAIRIESRADHAAAFARISALLLLGDPVAVKAEAPDSAAIESPAKALVMIGLAESQLDRVFLSASIELKAIAIRALLRYDQHSTAA